VPLDILGVVVEDEVGVRAAVAAAVGGPAGGARLLGVVVAVLARAKAGFARGEECVDQGVGFGGDGREQDVAVSWEALAALDDGEGQRRYVMLKSLEMVEPLAYSRQSSAWFLRESRSETASVRTGTALLAKSC
jgi:hypothetical protein